jgi:hypothetical protein
MYLARSGLGDNWGADTSPSGDAGYIQNLIDSAGQTSALTGTSIIDSLGKLAQTVALTVQQKQILDTQMARMRAGLPPLDASQYGVGVSVGVSADLQKYILYGGLALLAILYMGKRR